ncbi:MAG: hypothetical protein FWG47_07520, partial [Propionibacteriaceae bacterium]|nr:hypothetical protein [Propionibacteriaceae bacterium]
MEPHDDSLVPQDQSFAARRVNDEPNIPDDESTHVPRRSVHYLIELSGDTSETQKTPRRLSPLGTTASETDIGSDPFFSSIFVTPEIAENAIPLEAYASQEATTPKTSEAKHAKPFTFKGAMFWTILGTLIPGAGLIRAGRKAVGSIAVMFFLGIGVAIGALAVFNRGLIIRYVADPDVLTAVAAVLLALGVVLALIIVTSHLSLRPGQASTGQRIGGAVLVGALVMTVGTP